MDRFYTAIAILVLLLIIWALAAYCLDLGKENRRQRDQIKSLYNIKRVPVTPTVVHDTSLMDAIETALPENTAVMAVMAAILAELGFCQEEIEEMTRKEEETI